MFVLKVTLQCNVQRHSNYACVRTTRHDEYRHLCRAPCSGLSASLTVRGGALFGWLIFQLGMSKKLANVQIPCSILPDWVAPAFCESITKYFV